MKTHRVHRDVEDPNRRRVNTEVSLVVFVCVFLSFGQCSPHSGTTHGRCHNNTVDLWCFAEMILLISTSCNSLYWLWFLLCHICLAGWMGTLMPSFSLLSLSFASEPCRSLLVTLFSPFSGAEDVIGF